jgi:hypothetical protein
MDLNKANLALDAWMDKIWGDKSPRHKAENRAEIVKNYDIENDASWSIVDQTLSNICAQRRDMSDPECLFEGQCNPRLEAARWDHMIPDAAFDLQAAFDRILVWQVDPFLVEKARPGSSIVAARMSQDRESFGSCDGIILTAGAAAMDHLRSNGMDVGHKISFSKTYLQKKRVSWTDAGQQFVGLILAGDIMGSYDLAQDLREGRMKLKYKGPTAAEPVRHYYQSDTGTDWCTGAEEAPRGHE